MDAPQGAQPPPLGILDGLQHGADALCARADAQKVHGGDDLRPNRRQQDLQRRAIYGRLPAGVFAARQDARPYASGHAGAARALFDPAARRGGGRDVRLAPAMGQGKSINRLPLSFVKWKERGFLYAFKERRDDGSGAGARGLRVYLRRDGLDLHARADGTADAAIREVMVLTILLSVFTTSLKWTLSI